jgi:DNA-binding Lrp family transcriptional regulator
MSFGNFSGGQKAFDAEQLTGLDRALLDEYQRGFPLVSRPFAHIASELGVSEETVLDSFAALRELGVISRIGAVVRPHRAGWSTLAALAVPEDRLDQVATVVSGFSEVNHNYERRHELNLWFVVTAPDPAAVNEVLKEIERQTGLEVIDLPLEESFRVDLGFPI